MTPLILISLLGLGLLVIPETDGLLSCDLETQKITKEWQTMNTTCTQKMKEQVQKELTASMTYLAMGSHFLQDKVNRPGFAKFFLDSASEEREHALKIMEYLLMRGELTTKEDFTNLINSPGPNGFEWKNGEDALRKALDLEISVTQSIRGIIEICEGTGKSEDNDYHLSDWLTGDFLDEQYKGQRELAGKISTLSKMINEHGTLGEFLYDKNLL